MKYQTFFYLTGGLHCTCIFRTCVFHPCRFVLAFSVHAFSILAKCAVSYLPFRYLRFPVLAFSAPPKKTPHRAPPYEELDSATIFSLFHCENQQKLLPPELHFLTPIQRGSLQRSTDLLAVFRGPTFKGRGGEGRGGDGREGVRPLP